MNRTERLGFQVDKYDHPYLFKRPWSVWFSQGHKDGSAVLRGEASWRTINGVGINGFGRNVWITRKPIRGPHD